MTSSLALKNLARLINLIIITNIISLNSYVLGYSTLLPLNWFWVWKSKLNRSPIPFLFEDPQKEKVRKPFEGNIKQWRLKYQITVWRSQHLTTYKNQSSCHSISRSSGLASSYCHISSFDIAMFILSCSCSFLYFSACLHEIWKENLETGRGWHVWPFAFPVLSIYFVRVNWKGSYKIQEKEKSADQ